MNVEAENAVMREKARIREAVVNLPTAHQMGDDIVLIQRKDVLAIINGDHDKPVSP